MALIELNVGFSDIDNDSITRIQFRTRPVGSTGDWTEKVAQTLDPAQSPSSSPFQVAFDSTSGVPLVSGMYNLQIKLYDGYLWSDWSTNYTVEIGIESFFTNVVKNYNLQYVNPSLPYCGEIIDFNVYKCVAGTDYSTVTIKPILNSGAGFKVDIYQTDISNPLATYNFGTGLLPNTAGFLADPAKNYKMVFTPTQYNSSSVNSIAGTVIFENDSNPLTKSISFVLKVNGLAAPIPYNGIWAQKIAGVWTIRSMYNVTSNRVIVVTQDGATRTYNLLSPNKSVATTAVNSLYIESVEGPIDGNFYYVLV